MNFTRTIALFLLVATTATAQKFEMGKVSIAELQETAHPIDPTASAAVLFEKGEVHFTYSQHDGFDMVLDVKGRIKIYKKDGSDWANKVVYYYIGNGSKEKISFSDVATYNLVNGKIEKTKMKSDGAFDEKVNKYFGSYKITLPNVKEGSVIEYSYTITSPYVSKFRDWNFQNSIPVNYSEFKTYIPEYFVYNANQRGTIFPKMKSEKMQKTISYTYREENEPGGTIIHSASQQKLEFVETITTYLAENMPALKEESYVNNIKNYTSGVAHELSMTRYPNQPYKSYSTNWETVAKEIYQFDSFGLELNKTGYFEEDLNRIVNGKTDSHEIIATIFDYVKSSVKWNNYNDYTCDDGVKSAYKNKTGNVAEINLMLTAMLRAAGLNANPVLLSTRSNGISYFPNRFAFNYVIAGIELPDGLMLLDATEKYAVPNLLPTRDLNWVGRLIRKDGSSQQVDLMPKSLSREINYMSVVLGADGAASGKIRTQLTDYCALEYRSKAVGVNKDAFTEELENKKNAIEISEYVRDNDLDLAKPVVESFNFKDNRDIEVIGGKMYLSPLLFLNNAENPFKQEKREYPVDFGYPKEMKFSISIEIPKGYTIESLPKPINLVTGDDIGAFKYNIATSDNKIQVSITSTMNIAIISADYYDILKDFYQKILEKQNEKIVLIKS